MSDFSDIPEQEYLKSLLEVVERDISQDTDPGMLAYHQRKRNYILNALDLPTNT